MNECHSVALLLWSHTVEPRLTDTPEERTPMIKWTILKVPTVLPITSILKQPLNVDTPLLRITDIFHCPNCMQAILNDPD